jgi:hypothetical protein
VPYLFAHAMLQDGASYASGVPSTLTHVIFKNVESLTNSTTIIATNAFYGMSNLKYLELPSTITAIGDASYPANTFSSCNSLETIRIKAITPPTLSANLPSSLKIIYVPASSVDVYKSSGKWSNYADLIIGE